MLVVVAFASDALAIFDSKALARGSYRARITATDAAGNRSKARTATFTIVGR